jgi:glucoamylase
MPKSINFGNGTALIGLDGFGQVKDLYYHYPGLENHVSEELTHKIGFFVDGTFSWMDGGGWEVVVSSKKSTMASEIKARNDSLGIELNFTDVLYNEKNIFVREIVVKNLFDRSRDIKIFFNQEFNISETHIGGTAYYDPREEVMVHYKGRRVFLINTMYEGRSGFDEYSVGLIGIEGQVGTYRDAEDGKLSGNAIEHGQVDSVISVNVSLEPNDQKTLYYWMCIAKSIDKAKILNSVVLSRNPREIINSTINYWTGWVKAQNFSFYGLGGEVVKLFEDSLFYIKAHSAKNGAIIASGDSEMLQFGRDYYRYVWPRDGAYAAIALMKAGDFNAAKKFIDFCEEVISPEGYFMHKFRPDKSLGSSWHPWVRNGTKQFPIQEDETAIVVYALWKLFELSKDIEFVESKYNPLIKKASNFMVSYLDEKTGLPKGSYDLWEQDYGISTYTASSVYGALIAASKLSKILGKIDNEKKYLQSAERIRVGILKYLYDTEDGYFYKHIDTTTSAPSIKKTVDFSSIYGVYKFGVLDPSDKKFQSALSTTLERLNVKTDIGGYARYEGDTYHFSGGNYPGNPWIITSMWYCQYIISKSKSLDDLSEAVKLMTWVNKLKGRAGTLPEQVDPYSGAHVSASPLVWSHAEFVTSVIEYLQKLEQLGICKTCYPIA